MKKYLLLLSILVFSGLEILKAGNHETTYKFWVELKDKNGTPYSILKPWDFLSERSLVRRRKTGFSVCIQDLPVAPAYVKSVKDLGVKIQLTSRWMNAILVSTQDSALATEIGRQSFVKKVTLMGYWTRSRGAAGIDPSIIGEFADPMDYNAPGHINVKNTADPENYNNGYGLGWDQAAMLHATDLHKKGYKGRGIWVAVLDAGFYRANVLEAFDSLRANHRILGSVDLVDLDKDVYNDDDHGTQVLGCMAANVPGVMIGTAPEASYFLIRTEDARSEFPSEEAQWLAGAELADSMGVDMINSSLGYTEFDKSEFGHTYSELNGHSSLITQAANMAFDRGIVMVNSAGNEGDEKWEKIGAPADADGVIAVAAVDADGNRAGFSSMGPTYDKRMKPDLAAMGKRAIIAGTSGYFYGSNGTSYSAPILAGAIASFMQLHPEMSASQIKSLVCMSAVNYMQPDSLLGCGIPNFQTAMLLAAEKGEASQFTMPAIGWPVADTLHANLELKRPLSAGGLSFTLHNENGKPVQSGVLSLQQGIAWIGRIRFPKKGWYTLTVSDGKESWGKRILFEP